MRLKRSQGPAVLKKDRRSQCHVDRHFGKSLRRQRTNIAGKPVLILWGLKDIAFREKELKTWQQLFTDGRIHRLVGVGHFVQEEYGREAVPIITEYLR